MSKQFVPIQDSKFTAKEIHFLRSEFSVLLFSALPFLKIDHFQNSSLSYYHGIGSSTKYVHVNQKGGNNMKT
jgi:hypothetical protein